MKILFFSILFVFNFSSADETAVAPTASPAPKLNSLDDFGNKVNGVFDKKKTGKNEKNSLGEFGDKMNSVMDGAGKSAKKILKASPTPSADSEKK